jgi:RNA recognition motif-containing protein
VVSSEHHRTAKTRDTRDRTSEPCLDRARVGVTEKRKTIQTKLFVGNLSFDTTSEQLRELFAKAGEVVSVTLPTDRETGRPRGFAFVELSSSEQAATATQKFNGYELGGRALRVNEATERAPRRPSLPTANGFGMDEPAFRPRPKGSRRNLRGRKRSFG